MTDDDAIAKPGEHAPYKGGPAIFVLSIMIPVLMSMVLLAIAPGKIGRAHV